MITDLRQRTALQCELVADVARAFGEVRLKVTGASMLPAVWPGDLVTVQPSNIAALQPGQIVSYRREQRLITHRIKCIFDGHLIVQGDSVRQCDAPVSASEVVGQVTCILRNGRHISPEQTFWQRTGSSILRRSDFTTRMTLRLGRLLRRLRFTEMLWAS
jgi:signal peptidase I